MAESMQIDSDDELLGVENVVQPWRYGPAWLGPLLRERFWVPCLVHPELVQGTNHFCLDCVGQSMCSICVYEHQNHQTLQIRRSSYHNVVRVRDVEALLDISLVQPYVLNAARVVFLNKRPLAPSHAIKCVTDAGACKTCSRALVDAAFFFCSIACKLEEVAKDDSLKMNVGPEPKPDESDDNNPPPQPDDDNPPPQPDDDNPPPQPDDKNPPPEAKPVLSFRYRPRKGIPMRAPFF